MLEACFLGGGGGGGVWGHAAPENFGIASGAI